MQQIILFFIRKKNFFMFLLLFSFSISLIFRDNFYPQSKFINSANAVSGTFYRFTNYWRQYFDLRTQNEMLSEENRELRRQLLAMQQYGSRYVFMDSLQFFDSLKYEVRKANVIRNSFLHSKNYMTIDRGAKDGITQDMGVISSKGIVGIIENTGNRFSTVQSVLNTKSALNAMVKNSGHFGSLKWNGDRINVVQLVDIPNIAPIQEGDTVITGGMSNIFPKGIPVGKIAAINRSQMDNSYVIDVELFTDMAKIDFVYIIENKDKQEIHNLENQISYE
ncbi:rod shape-determining protein MreC [Capnocytophaga canis]|uniref:rod shape-determining protein MreC n=1 Tax=Capnocytophaga canis TaxID=1848903 RepID=UPI00370D40C8